MERGRAATAAAGVGVGQKNEREPERDEYDDEGEGEDGDGELSMGPPRELMASMSELAKIVGALDLTAGGGGGLAEGEAEGAGLLQRVRDAFAEDPSQWRAEVLQSVRRMERMLGRMERWQARVGPGEIEALKRETARLELRVRAVVDQKAISGQGQDERMPGALDFPEAFASTPPSSLKNGKTTTEQEDSDADSTSDGASDIFSAPSESGTGPTELEPDSGPVSDIRPPIHFTTPQPFPPPPIPVPSLPPFVPPPPPAPAAPPTAPPRVHNGPPMLTPTGISPTAGSSLGHAHTHAVKNYNTPPPAPPAPEAFLARNPWSMLEHGWTFLAEAYNNVLITRPLQEWFGKQAAESREEERCMRVVLARMRADTRVPAPAADASHVQTQPQPQPQTGPGEREKSAPFGSAAARAEAAARATDAGAASSSTSSQQATVPPPAPMDKNAPFVTRLPYPIVAQPSRKGKETPSAAPPPPPPPSTGPPPAQRILALPKRRAPLSLRSADAKAFAHVMQTAMAGPGARPGGSAQATRESRESMLALYEATRTRFPVRSPWDCWHRWHTPWVVPEREQADGGSEGTVVFDYLLGNLAQPCGGVPAQAPGARGKGKAAAGGWVYRPVPGTFPDARGVQHELSGAYDPRPGMVALTRMSHVLAEMAWSGAGMGRFFTGIITEDVLANRRVRMPATLDGLWPRKASQPKAAPPARHGVPNANQAVSLHGTSAAGTLFTSVPPTGSPLVPQQPSPAAPPLAMPALRTATAPSARPQQQQQQQHPPHQNPPPQSQQQQQQQLAPPPPPPTTQQQPLPYLPHPTPRPPPRRDPPRVPEGTLGHPTRPGMLPWFCAAVVRADVLRLVTGLQRAERAFRDAFAPAPAPPEAERRVREWEREREREREEFGCVPAHLRGVGAPPPPPLVASSSASFGLALGDAAGTRASAAVGA
ncbi:uncharacterized protein BXZ73DRAFT_88899 [Epithele typhae]|uniref:uncharacterized protein n=1 Tax=Epithele typhae TaxID=378194 RepID=UPI002007939E|nr:uncharacterized protein BXZ73DRAFT_88899 [Epithele typhae]KAH9939676.1 hypothetical protein BXZ73DRAFT_88899 [Epithele typhae]